MWVLQGEKISVVDGVKSPLDAFEAKHEEIIVSTASPSQLWKVIWRWRWIVV